MCTVDGRCKHVILGPMGNGVQNLDSPIQDALWHGIRSIAAEQLPHGEIPNYRRLPNGCWEYCFSPLVSAYTYSALGCFDPSCKGFDLQSLEYSGATHMQALGRMAMEIRRGIYRFLCWQQSTRGTWRFFGQGSGLPADLDTTSCAAAIFLDRRGSEQSCGFRRTLEAFSSFPVRDGTLDSPNSRGPGFDGALELRRVANANTLRCFALAGLEYGALASKVLLDSVACISQSPMRLALLYALGRAYRQGQVTILGELAEQILREVSKPCAQGDQVGGPLSTALALSTLLDFGSTEAVLEVGINSLVRCIMAHHGARLEAFCDEQCGSPALTTAISMAALSRAATLPYGGNGESRA
jgi:hypothetical protein